MMTILNGTFIINPSYAFFFVLSFEHQKFMSAKNFFRKLEAYYIHNTYIYVVAGGYMEDIIIVKILKMKRSFSQRV
jgi:hypothetical protein